MSEDAHRQRAAAIFQSLLEQPREERDAALAAACGADGALEAMVRSLLAMDEQLYSSSDDIQLSALLPNQQLKVPALIQAGQPIGRHIARHRLGLGGMAEVWAVQHEVLGTWHALKVLLWASEPLKQRLLLEGRTQARLVHDNILPVRDILDLSGTPALLMPLVEGPSLDTLLSNHTLSTNDALAIFHGILAGIHHAHSAGVIHRDIKPGNILLTLRQGRLVPLVADFGLVKDGHGVALTATGVRMGTPAYAAPEQLFDASTADARADLFALGVMLTEMLTGHRPFSGGTIEQILDAHQHPPDLTGTPEALRPLLLDLLQVDPEQRTRSVAEVVAALPLLQPISGTLLNAVHALKTSPQPSTTTTQHSGTPQPPHNLPRARDRFIGRGPDQRALRDWLESSERGRLLTVTGPGGTGKTRLCQELGRVVLADWPGGVWWVDLSEVTEQTALLAAVSRALKKNLQSPTPDAVGTQLSGLGKSLVFLDNFEQLVDLGAGTVGRWLEQAPEVAFVVTSRSPLRLRGEKLYPVDPLDVSCGAQLFVDRAQALNPSFSLTEESRPEVEELVSLLDGLPLAIELAAARSRTMTPARLLKRLSRRFDLLTSRSPELPARQRTLRATLQWSWDLLSPIEKAALAQCSVFHGGFTIEAAEEVIDLSAFDDPWVEDILAALVDRSLLRAVTDCSSGELRLSMLVSVQAFATDKLTETEPTRQRHASYYANFGADTFLNRPDVRAILTRELGNLLHAARWALRSPHRTTATRAAHAILEIITHSGSVQPGLQLAEDVLAMWSDEIHIQRAWLLQRLGRLYEVARPEEATLALSATGIAVCAALGGAAYHPQVLIHLHTSLFLARLRRFAESSTHLIAAEALLPARPVTQGDRDLLCRVLVNRADLLRRSRDNAAAIPLYERAIPLVRAMGKDVDTSVVLNNMSIAYRLTGQLSVARRHLTEALALAKANDAFRLQATILHNLSNSETDPVRVMAWVKQAHALNQKAGSIRNQLTSMDFLIRAHMLSGQLDDAQRILTRALKMARQHGYPVLIPVLYQRQSVILEQTVPPEEARARILTMVEELDPKRHSELVGSIHGTLGQIAIITGDLKEAQAHLEEAVERVKRVDRARCQMQILLWKARRLDGLDADDLAAAIEGMMAGYDANLLLHRVSWLTARVVVARHTGDATDEAAARRELAALQASLDHPLRFNEQRMVDALPSPT